jgi:MFS family permease
MVLWANLHGTFPLGIAFVLLSICATAIDTRRELRAVAWRPIALTAIACALAPLVNPQGSALIGYVLSLVRNPSVRIAREWQAVTLADAEGKYIVAVLLLTVLIAAWKRPRVGDFVVLLPFVVLELRAVRGGIWLSFILGPILSGWLAKSPPRSPADRPTAILVVAGVTVPLLLAVPWVKPRLAPSRFSSLAFEERTPMAAVRALANDDQRPAHLLHGMAVGSYLIWALPSQPVFVDPRLEFYPLAQWKDLEQLERAQDIDPILARYDGRGFLCTKQRETPLITALRRRPEFEMRYEDSSFAYFVKR